MLRWKRLSSSLASQVLQSPLKPVHVDNKGKLVEFAGWELPVQYDGAGVMTESLHTRSKVSIFDVSHMQQLKLHGPKSSRVAFLEKVTVSSVGNLKPDQGQYTLFTNPEGGIIDDAVVANREEYNHIVCNAACAAKDIAHLTKQLKGFNHQNNEKIEMEVISDQALIALQGPLAVNILSGLLSEQRDKVSLEKLTFFFSTEMTIAGIGCTVSRSGYTGEDGFEISIPIPSSVDLVQELLQNPDCKLAGLGARDALRLEAGLCLYGHDLDDSISPVDAGLSWTIGKRRKKEGGFLGADHILGQLQGSIPVERKRVGLIVDGAPAREGATVVDSSENDIGKITSGGYSPVLKCPIAMGYISSQADATPDAKVGVQVRGKTYPARIATMPFVPTHYVKTPKTK
uniref:Aminomethyltransferase n=1 Tax=Spongospora subterranea TaxID=70186 RepID=A0A0H5QI44_9EUKA|eukprot:CRZ01663.1 hypothetical protein [Spongospora subterranea]